MNSNSKTSKATQAASAIRKLRRKELRERIRVEFFRKHCICEDENCKNGDYSNICISFSSLAKVLNERKISTLSGIGSWSTTQVSRLFKRKVTSKNINHSKSSNKENEKTSLDGLI